MGQIRSNPLLLGNLFPLRVHMIISMRVKCPRVGRENTSNALNLLRVPPSFWGIYLPLGYMLVVNLTVKCLSTEHEDRKIVQMAHICLGYPPCA